MKKNVFKVLLFVILISIIPNTAYPQMNTLFQRMFSEFLRERMFSFGPFGRGFDAAALEADTTITKALNSLIAANVSSFPLTSTNAAIILDLETGKTPETPRESLGPLFTESAQTIGRKLNLSFNFSHYNLAEFRGFATEDFRFAFTYADVNLSGVLGDHPAENDVVEIFPDLNIDASTAVFYATYGLTGNFDASLAVPIINLNLSGTARVVINSVSFFQSGLAINSFNGDPLNPSFDTTFTYNESITGLGDVALRLKYHFPNTDHAGMVDIRLPTGDEKEFLGTGKANAKFMWIWSKVLSERKLSDDEKVRELSMHLNLAYERRGGQVDSDEIEFNLGMDQKLSESTTLILSLLGEYDLQKEEGLDLLPGTRLLQSNTVIEVDRSNVPESQRDNTLTLALGVRYAPSSKFLFLGNLLVPLNDQGLRSSIAPTIGIALTL